MDTAFAPTPPAAPTERWFTVAEYHAMGDAGVFGPDERVELLEGRIVRKTSPVGDRHAWCVELLTDAVYERYRQRARVRVQSPIRLDDRSEPEPDLVLYRRDLAGRHPRPEDLHLVVEVSDATLAHDLTTKAALCARHGVAEYWVVDLAGPVVLVHRRPSEDGYVEVVRVGPGGALTVAAFPDAPPLDPAAFLPDL